MARACIAALMLAGCSTTATPRDIELTNGGILFGIEACERQVTEGVPLEQVLKEAARGRSHARYTSSVPGANLQQPIWKLDGLVWVGLNLQGRCEVYASSGSGLAARDAVVASRLAMSSRRWSPIRVIPAPAGETRDGLCTTDRVPEGKALSIAMTSRTNAEVTMQRSFIATVVLTRAEDCTSRRLS